MLIDCDSCAARGQACSGCVVSVVLTPPALSAVDWDDTERRALTALTEGGLRPALLMTPAPLPGQPRRMDPTRRVG
jgi:hypothetical protein